ncbi:MAG: xanthine dehydrogenase family protein molybdopterin-binding subunit, partial [Chloroflexi bacterium]|nr:xanthine dehydrogenase family protein molybdopterin-binding subunit [Chloroflexota bacterium]
MIISRAKNIEEMPMTNFTAVGRPTPLADGRAKVTGATRFTSDLQLPGMLHARFVTSIYAHANLRRIDSSAAMAVPGVAAVLTAKDLPDIAPSSRSRLLLARGRVVFMGQPVAMVLAMNEAAAEDGAQKVVVDYEPLPAAITMDDSLTENAPLVWSEGAPGGSEEAGAHGGDVGGESATQRKKGNIAGEASFKRGDVAAGFAEADVIIEGTFTTPMVHQSAVEPRGVIAAPTTDSQWAYGNAPPLSSPLAGGTERGGMSIWACTQNPFGVRREVAEVLGVPETSVRVQGMAVGGGFGSKFGLYEPLVAVAARAVNRPVSGRTVRWGLTRDSAATNGGTRPVSAPEGDRRLRPSDQ